jgi:hypothetical protein
MVRNLPSIQSFKWIVSDGLIKNYDKPADRYVLPGIKYLRSKVAISEFIGLNKHDALVTFIKSTKDNMFAYMYMALYQQVTLIYRKLNPTDISIKLLENMLKETNPNEKHLWAPLLENG